MKINSKQIAITALSLAICIVSIYFLKPFSPYFAGPIVNLCILIVALSAGIVPGIILSIIAPIVSAMVQPLPLPQLLPVVMGGNIIFAVFAFLGERAEKKSKRKTVVLHGFLILGSIVKAGFMYIVGVLLVLSVFGKNLPEPKIKAISLTFSVTQLVTALIASAIAIVVWWPLKKYLKRGK